MYDAKLMASDYPRAQSRLREGDCRVDYKRTNSV